MLNIRRSTTLVASWLFASFVSAQIISIQLYAILRTCNPHTSGGKEFTMRLRVCWIENVLPLCKLHVISGNENESVRTHTSKSDSHHHISFVYRNINKHQACLGVGYYLFSHQPLVNQSITFTGSCFLPPCQACGWVFGDGTSSSASCTINHSYSAAGSYSVSMRPVNANGDLES